MNTLQSPNQNLLLAALPPAEFERIAPRLEWVAMPLGEVIYESGGQLRHVYFPTTAIVSLHYVLENGASSEIAGVGNEGVLGISLFLGGNTTPSRATVNTGGYGSLAGFFLAVGVVTWAFARHKARTKPRLFAASLSELVTDRQQLISRI